MDEDQTASVSLHCYTSNAEGTKEWEVDMSRCQSVRVQSGHSDLHLVLRWNKEAYNWECVQAQIATGPAASGR